MSDREQRDGGRSAENNKNNRGGNGRRNERRNHQDLSLIHISEPTRPY